MKIQIRNYAFNPVAKTVTFKDYTSIPLESVLLIVNATDNLVMYNFANPAMGGTVSGNVLTLFYDTSLMSSSDKLLIYFDTDQVPASDESLILLRRIVQLVTPLATQDINQRQRITLDAMTSGLTLSTVSTVSTVTTVSTVSNVNSFAGIDLRYQFIDAARNAYANGIRQNLIFS